MYQQWLQVVGLIFDGAGFVLIALEWYRGYREMRNKVTLVARNMERAEKIRLQRDLKDTIGNVGVCAGHLIDGGDGTPPKVINPPLADPTHKEFLQGETTTLTYNDAGQGWKYEKSNYMRNKFKVDDRQYAKHEAEMAKKMEAMKKAEGKAEKPEKKGK